MQFECANGKSADKVGFGLGRSVVLDLLTLVSSGFCVKPKVSGSRWSRTEDERMPTQHCANMNIQQ